jgi:hypothetical protein
MARHWDGVERRARGEDVGRRAHARALWTNVRVERADYDARGDGAARAWVRLGTLAPADVVVELVTLSRGECRMWCEQSYHNGSYAYAASAASLADDVGDREDAPETWAVRVRPARRWTGAPDLPPVVGAVAPVDCIARVARVTSGSDPTRAPAARTRCGA